MERKMFVFDIDGTLLNDDKKIVHETIGILKKAQSLGHVVCLATGRSPFQLNEIINEIGIEKYTINMNGGIINNLITKKFEILATPLPLEVKKAYIAVAEKYGRELQWATAEESKRVWLGDVARKDITDNDFFIGGTINPSYWDYKDVKNELLTKDVIHMGYKAEKALIAIVKPILKELEEEYKVNISVTGQVYLDADANFVSKFNAIKIVQERENISNANTYCFGDSDNDISMVSQAGHGIAMGNATENVKAVATHIIADNNSTAIADFIKDQII